MMEGTKNVILNSFQNTKNARIERFGRSGYIASEVGAETSSA